MNGLIYGALVLMWAVVLLPMWVRRHEESTEAHSVDRFTNAMRVLSRRPDDQGAGGSVDRREVLMPARSQRNDVSVQGHPPRRSSSAAKVVSRRRRTLIVLGGLVVVVAVVAGLGWVPIVVVALPVLLLVGYLVHLRGEARRAADRVRRHEMARRRAARRYAGSDRDGAYVPAYVTTVVDDLRPTASAPTPEGVADVEAVAIYDAVAEQVWEPVPVPLPTYVTAPAAPRQVRVIDLTKSGSWTTSGHLSPQEQADYEQGVVAESREQIVDHAQEAADGSAGTGDGAEGRRAVND